jgi:Cu/Ag efflux pump CusA
MPPEEMEQLITFVIESNLVGSEGVRRVQSRSILGFSSVQVEFDWNISVPHARQIVTERLQGLSDQLPGQAGSPFLAPVTSIMGEIMLAGFTAEETSLMDLRTEIDFVVRRELLAMPGVAAISVYGGDKQEFVIEPDPVRLEQSGHWNQPDTGQCQRSLGQHLRGIYELFRPRIYHSRIWPGFECGAAWQGLHQTR